MGRFEMRKQGRGKTPLTAGEMMLALERRYSSHEWAFFPQVRSAAGYFARRTADAVALNLWPSRGLELHGFELKASRSDWLRELKNPSKAEAIFSFCDRWWVVADAIVLDGELPPTWGLLVPRGKDLVVKVQAPKLEPQPMDRSFVAAMLKRARAYRIDPRPDVESDQYRRGVEAGKLASQSTVDTAERMAAMHKDHLTTLRGQVEDFQTKSGFCISGWDAGRIGEAVRTVRDAGRLESAVQRAEQIAGEVRRLHASVECNLQRLRDVADENPVGCQQGGRADGPGR